MLYIAANDEFFKYFIQHTVSFCENILRNIQRYYFSAPRSSIRTSDVGARDTTLGEFVNRAVKFCRYAPAGRFGRDNALIIAR